jgi:hypothetical protein
MALFANDVYKVSAVASAENLFPGAALFRRSRLMFVSGTS